jgi:hypothetical protein
MRREREREGGGREGENNDIPHIEFYERFVK